MPLVKQSLWTSRFSKNHFVIPLFGGKLRGDIGVAKGKDMDNGVLHLIPLSKTQSLTAAGKHKNTYWSRSGSTKDDGYNYYNNTPEEIMSQTSAGNGRHLPFNNGSS
ncbi:Lethal(2) giant larvae protein 2, partial [Clarias magur]